MKNRIAGRLSHQWVLLGLLWANLLISGAAEARCGYQGGVFTDDIGRQIKIYFKEHGDPVEALRFDSALQGQSSSAKLSRGANRWLAAHKADSTIVMDKTFLAILNDLRNGATWIGSEMPSDAQFSVTAMIKDIRTSLASLRKNGLRNKDAERAVMIRFGSDQFALYRYHENQKRSRAIPIVGLDHPLLHDATIAGFQKSDLLMDNLKFLFRSGRIGESQMLQLFDVLQTASQKKRFLSRASDYKTVSRSVATYSDNLETQDNIRNFFENEETIERGNHERDRHMAQKIIQNMRSGLGIATIGLAHEPGIAEFLAEYCRQSGR